ncbi:ABC transporter permease [Pedobacter sp. NJ-S-72]
MNIGGLAIGMACCLLLLLYVSYEWGYDKQFKNIDRIFISRLNIDINGKLATTIATPDRLAAAASEILPGVEQVSRMVLGFNDDKLFSRDQEHYKLKAAQVDPSFLQIFEYKFIYGNKASALGTPNSVLITESTARKLFGNQNPIGQSIEYDNRKFLKNAVIEDLPKNQSNQFDALLSWSFFEQEHPESKNNSWGSITCATFFKLKDKNQFEAVDAGLRRMIKANDKNTQLEAFLLPYTKYHLYNDFVNGKPSGGRIDQVRLFAFLAFCVLLIASINYMNLSTARSEKRAREVGVRKALGSTRTSLMGQFIIESMLFSIIAVIVVAFGLLELSLPYFNNLLDISMHIGYNSYPFWLTLCVLVILTGVLAGSYPAFYLSSFTPIKVLKGLTGIGRSSLPVRKILVVLQFSLSICMIICAIIIYSQIQYMKNKPLGFSQSNLVEMNLEGEWRKPEKLELFKAELKKSGAVISATEFAQSFTSEGSITGNLSWPGKPDNDNSVIDYRSIGYDFSSTIGAQIVEGRDLSPKFVADTATSILINEALAKTMELKSPVGTIIHWGDNPPLTIVGVVKNYSNENIGGKTLPTFFFYNVKKSNVLILRINPDENLSGAISKIKQISKQLNPAYPSELSFVAQDLKAKLKSEQLLSVLSNFFGGFAIFYFLLRFIRAGIVYGRTA